MSRDLKKEPASTKEAKGDEILDSLVVSRFINPRHYHKLTGTTGIVIEMSILRWRCYRAAQARSGSQQNTAVVCRSVR